MLGDLFRFRTRHQPYMVRLSYRYEMRSALTYPLAASLAEGSFTGVVAAKYFQASPMLIAVITAAPMFGNIAAILWAELAKSRRKVPFVNLLQLGVVLSVAAVALTYPLPLNVGGWMFASMIILARVMAAGIVTVRSIIWRTNYPRYLRGQIVARISVVATAMLAATTFAGSWWLDHNPQAYIYLYPAAALLGAIGIWQFSHIRVRQEGRLLRHQRLYAARPENMAQTGEGNVLNYQPKRGRAGTLASLRAFFADSFAVLRQDKLFRDYQRWQFLSGASFMMLNPPLVFMVSKEMTDPATEYLLATVVLQIIPMITSILATQLWAPLFDRLHIAPFRVAQGFVSAASQLLLFAGAIGNSLWMVVAAQFMIGVSNAAGNLAWNLGHNEFAPAEKATTYMGVHVMLTGLRGFVAPFVGVWLFQTAWIGRNVFLVAAVVSIASLLGFASLARRMRESRPATAPRRGAGRGPVTQGTDAQMQEARPVTQDTQRPEEAAVRR